MELARVKKGLVSISIAYLASIKRNRHINRIIPISIWLCWICDFCFCFFDSFPRIQSHRIPTHIHISWMECVRYGSNFNKAYPKNRYLDERDSMLPVTYLCMYVLISWECDIKKKEQMCAHLAESMAITFLSWEKNHCTQVASHRVEVNPIFPMIKEIIKMIYEITWKKLQTTTLSTCFW